ncbi:MAG: hypothetical protein U1F68_01950 [Gammaproteobacteria bacterium]
MQLLDFGLAAVFPPQALERACLNACPTRVSDPQRPLIKPERRTPTSIAATLRN